MRSLKVYALALLLAGCTPKSSIIYMSREVDNPERVTYSVSDPKDKAKEEILKIHESEGNIPHSFLELIMRETSQRGLVVQVNQDWTRTEVVIYAPIVFNERDGVEAHFQSAITFYDEQNNGKLDMPRGTRKRLKNSANICEEVLKDYKERK